MQCTLVNRQKEPLQKAAAKKKSEVLAKAIKRTIRSGDVFTQYSTGQFLIILNQAEQENCGKIFKRILETYVQLGGSRREVSWQITPICSAKEMGEDDRREHQKHDTQ